jgi:hypothetical protein
MTQVRRLYGRKQSNTGRIRSYMTQVRRLYGRKRSNTGRIHAVFHRYPGRCFTTVFIPYRIRRVHG